MANMMYRGSVATDQLYCPTYLVAPNIRAQNFNAPNDVQLSNLNAFTAESSIAPSRALLAENITDEITDEENLTAVRTSLLGETVSRNTSRMKRRLKKRAAARK
jgi:hypothetical protein